MMKISEYLAKIWSVVSTVNHW